MGRFRDEIKKEIREEVKDIVYEKAKEEIKEKISGRFEGFKRKVKHFFGFTSQEEDNLNKISQEIKDSQNPVLDNQVLGIIELFSLNYARTATHFLLHTFGNGHQQKK